MYNLISSCLYYLLIQWGGNATLFPKLKTLLKSQIITFLSLSKGSKRQVNLLCLGMSDYY